MVDGEKRMTLHGATSWLRELALRDRRNTANLVLLYNFYRDRIEAAPSAKYDQSYWDGADDVIVGTDLR